GGVVISGSVAFSGTTSIEVTHVWLAFGGSSLVHGGTGGLQALHECLVGRPDAIDVLAVVLQDVLDIGDLGFEITLEVVRNFVAALFDQLLGLQHHAFSLVACIDRFLALGVFSSVLFGFLHHALAFLI